MNEAKTNHVRSLKKVKLVLGNGFDLQCQLETKYSQFFEANKGIQIIKTVALSNRIGDCMNYLNGTIRDNIFSNITLGDTSVWHLFFLLKSSLSKETRWCDIEQTMLDSFEMKKFRNNSFWENVYLAFSNPQFYYQNNRSEELKCAAFLKRKNYENRSSEDFYDNLMIELRIFEKQFGDYVKNEMKKTRSSQNYRDRADRFVLKILGQADEIEANPNILKRNNVISIDSFNYSTLGGVSYNKDKFRNINGDIDNPIFGIDSAKIDEDDPAYAFTKTSRRLILDINENNIYKIDDFENVIIYGHSLNEQDYSYFFPIFDHLKLDDASVLTNLIFAYSIYEEKKTKEIKKNQMKSICKIINLYEGYIHPGRKQKRLLDSLSAEGRIFSIEI